MSAPEKLLQSNAMSRPRLVALLLALVTLVVYLPVGTHGFLNYDDTVYVTENSFVKNGLTWPDIKWAFTTFYASNWHPFTWLSHMADCQLFGLNAGAHHFVNVLFHAANAVLLFALLLRLTNLLWPCAFIAALFAWHPLHVESVAWISERKDVLSTFFALLALLSYTRYAQKQSKVEGQALRAEMATPALNLRGSTFDYFLALIFFALGLMSKPMFVTLPFVMVLLDFWPLQRFSNFKFQMVTVTRLTLEKWPFFLLTAISCVVTFLAQRGGGAVASLKNVSLHYRLENAPLAVARYLLKMIWPTDLAVIYPMPDRIPPLAIVVSVLVLIFISAAAWLARKRSPHLFVGWLWFLGTLVPVIGLVQVGGAALADRYNYFPAIGIFLAITFCACDLLNRFQFPKGIFSAASVLILSMCLFLTEKQLGYWQDSESLFRHAIAVTKDNDIALVDLGVALEQQGKLNDALVEYRAAAKLTPGRYQIHNNLGNLLDNLGQPDAALAEYRTAIRLNPRVPVLHDSLGVVLIELGRFNEAMAEFSNAAQLDPASPWPHFEMAKALLKQGRDTEAIIQFHDALRCDLDNFQILAYTAHVLAADENSEIRDGKTALVLAAKANALTGGTQPQVLDALGMAYAEVGDFTNATEVMQRAIELATAAQMKKLEPLQQRLELYKNHRPWRESFLATNALPEVLPNN
ncbi:MAG: tetratricopeptide repeat protein [Verrucomicrobiota bacterium]